MDIDIEVCIVKILLSFFCTYFPTCDILLFAHRVFFGSPCIPVGVWLVPLQKFYSHLLVAVREDTER